ncbi:MAG: FeoB-associated Cys-rich membrane protein [Bacillota bacterium]|nr:FeoB-associated Cys-rich membrane protein [Bacillota bacterium]
MMNFILAGILLALVGTAVRYVVKAKKSGTKCIGCPSEGCGCGCGKH